LKRSTFTLKIVEGLKNPAKEESIGYFKDFRKS